MKILIPGRHHLLTDFQFKYFFRLLQTGLEQEPDVNGNPLGVTAPITELIFAVTSSNHSNTRRNPVPFFLRALPILDFCQELGVKGYIFGIDDVGHLDDFAGYTLKKIRHESDGFLDLTPENTLVACSTPVLEMYEAHGFRILPVELEERDTWKMRAENPWDLVERIARVGEDWRKDEEVLERMYSNAFHIWSQYRLGEKVRLLFSDDMIGDDGDLTATRDYASYVRSMDEIAELKFRETAPFIRPGRIGDIGCAVGTWIKLACGQDKFRESDFFGIEVARHLYQICLQRKENGEFENPFVFFSQKNAVTSLCFEPGSMDTIHCSSLTHEIESYGNCEDLLRFIQNRWEELSPGGVWINRDVVGPEDGNREVLLWLNEEDGRNEDWDKDFEDPEELYSCLKALSTFAIFQRFARDFRKGENGAVSFEWEWVSEKRYARISFRDAMEFIATKDYRRNWQSEMHERFCFWSFSDWKNQLESHGFRISPESYSFTNPWLVENRFRGKAELFELRGDVLTQVDYPVTHMVMVAEKIL